MYNYLFRNKHFNTLAKRRRGPQLCVWLSLSRLRPVFTPAVRRCSDVPKPKTPHGNIGNKAEVVKEKALSTLQNASAVGRQWALSSSHAASTTLNSWWSRYEEFVGINEVREAQTKVTQAEAGFMVSRSLVREAHVSLEALQVKLKEVRERLDRVSREEPRYLELATIEHKLLQEDRRLRSAYELAESSEREKFALFSAAVRESHEKERTRAERTKNWSLIGSVLGALIGVMGSTYVNRVRLQELKGLLLEAQKGPENLQEALRVQASNHRTQQEELGSLIERMRLTVHSSSPDDGAPERSAQVQVQVDPSSLGLDSSFQSLQEAQQATQRTLQGLKTDLDLLQNDVSVVKMIVEQHKATERKTKPVQVSPTQTLREEALVQTLEDSQRKVSERIRDSVVYNAAAAYTASAITVTVLYLLLRGATP